MPELKYLFVAEYSDGSTHQQGADDVSKIDPKKSAFYDIDQDKLVQFHLVEQPESDSSSVITLNLLNGVFTINGFAIIIHDRKLLDVMKIAPLRLIFFRRHVHHFNQTEEETVETNHIITYRLGWQTTFEGQNYQYVMEFE